MILKVPSLLLPLTQEEKEAMLSMARSLGYDYDDPCDEKLLTRFVRREGTSFLDLLQSVRTLCEYAEDNDLAEELRTMKGELA